MENKAILVGIDGFLRGNEGSIISYPPFIKSPTNKRYAAVLKIDWDSASGKNLSWISSREKIQDKGIYFGFKQDVFIKNNELAALIGPVFFAHLKQLGDEDILGALAGRIPIQEGFFIQCMISRDYNLFLETLSNTSKRVFDNEIENLSIENLQLSSRGKAALKLFTGNVKTKPEERYVVKLTAAMLEKDTRAFREYLELALIDFEESGISREVIKDWVKQYFEITNREIFELLYPTTPSREFIKGVVKESITVIIPEISRSLNSMLKEKVREKTKENRRRQKKNPKTSRISPSP